MSMISVQNLCKSYNAPVLKNINLEIEEGSTIGYIGPNGAGKSTTIKILTGIIPNFEGDVRVLGYDIRKNALDVKQRIGYIPEHAAVYDVLTPMEYLHFVGKLYSIETNVIEKKAQDLLHVFDLASKKDTRMTTFSKGMRQKVLLISGMMHNPDILFLDEPLSGLDANAVILVKEILAQLATSGKTLFYSSHIMDVVEKISSRIIIINNGQVIADGDFETLKNAGHTESLEQIFTQLTGDKAHTRHAKQFIDILKN